MSEASHPRPRLVALDIDGTLLGESGRLVPSARDAVAAVLARGVRVLLCTGRRFRTTLPIAQELGIEGPLVVNNGAVVREAASEATLDTRLLPNSLYAPAYALMREVGSPLVYLEGHPEDVDFCFEAPARAHAFQRAYLDAYGHNGRESPSLASAPHDRIIMLSQMADRNSLAALRPRIAQTLGPEVRTHLLANKNFEGSILEIASARAGKWNATLAIAERWGIAAHEILAIGDDQNDAEMIERAGIGIAMANAPAEVRSIASYVTASNDDDGVALALERFLLEGP